MPGDSNEEWPPPEARLRSIFWRAEGHLERSEFAAASGTLAEGFGLGDDELLHGLHHLAAAGYRAQTGELDRARRQLERARRRLAPYPDSAPLVAVVEAVIESADAEGGELE
jgi:hypothetical protein